MRQKWGKCAAIMDYIISIIIVTGNTAANLVPSTVYRPGLKQRLRDYPRYEVAEQQSSHRSERKSKDIIRNKTCTTIGLCM